MPYYFCKSQLKPFICSQIYDGFFSAWSTRAPCNIYLSPSHVAHLLKYTSQHISSVSVCSILQIDAVSFLRCGDTSSPVAGVSLRCARQWRLPAPMPGQSSAPDAGGATFGSSLSEEAGEEPVPRRPVRGRWEVWPLLSALGSTGLLRTWGGRRWAPALRGGWPSSLGTLGAHVARLLLGPGLGEVPQPCRGASSLCVPPRSGPCDSISCSLPAAPLTRVLLPAPPPCVTQPLCICAPHPPGRSPYTRFPAPQSAAAGERPPPAAATAPPPLLRARARPARVRLPAALLPPARAPVGRHRSPRRGPAGEGRKERAGGCWPPGKGRDGTGRDGTGSRSLSPALSSGRETGGSPAPRRSRSRCLCTMCPLQPFEGKCNTGG
ncbi:unnamed protein product [Natator depressus]